MDQNNTIFDDISIKSAARFELDMVARTSFSSGGFTSEQKDAIASAIAAGIQAYEKQKNN